MKEELFLFLVIVALRTTAQQVPVEVMFGHAGYYYQHSISTPANNDRIAFLNTSSLYYFLDNGRAEVMSQSYVSTRVTKWMRASAGYFHTGGTGLAPSVHVQLNWEGKRWVLRLVPRIDLRKSFSQDLFLFFEMKQPINGFHMLYFRTQMMFNYTRATHNRSYQFLRIGIAIHGTQFGLAANFDAYGRDMGYKKNYGVYVKRIF